MSLQYGLCVMVLRLTMPSLLCLAAFPAASIPATASAGDVYPYLPRDGRSFTAHMFTPTTAWLSPSDHVIKAYSHSSNCRASSGRQRCRTSSLSPGTPSGSAVGVASFLGLVEGRVVHSSNGQRSFSVSGRMWEGLLGAPFVSSARTGSAAIFSGRDISAVRHNCLADEDPCDSRYARRLFSQSCFVKSRRASHP